MSSDAVRPEVHVEVRPEVRPDTRFSRVSFPSLRDGSLDPVAAQNHARGHAAGYAAGLHAASDEIERLASELHANHEAVVRDDRARVEHATAALAASARALNERALPVIADVQDTLLAAALDLAEAILGYELSSVDNSARSALIRATTLIDPKVTHTVRMNPEDLAALNDLAVLDDLSLRDSTRTSSSVDFVADPSLQRGDAITEFPDGYLDARISTALARARDALQGGAL